MHSTVPIVGLDKNYRIIDNHYSLNKSNDNGSQIENQENKNSTEIILGAHRLPTPQPLMKHKMSKTPENLRHNSGLQNHSKSQEISKKVTIILGDLLVDYDRNERPGHGGINL